MDSSIKHDFLRNEKCETKIILIRGKRVMLDKDFIIWSKYH
jgi:hypothetical protein